MPSSGRLVGIVTLATLSSVAAFLFLKVIMTKVNRIASDVLKTLYFKKQKNWGKNSGKTNEKQEAPKAVNDVNENNWELTKDSHSQDKRIFKVFEKSWSSLECI